MSMSMLSDLKAQLAARQTRAAAMVAEADKKKAAEKVTNEKKKVERAAEKRLEAHVHSQIKRLDPADRELLLAEFGGDEEAAEKAAAEMLKGMTPERQRYLKFAGWNMATGLRHKRLSELVIVRQQLVDELETYNSLPAGAEKDALVAEVTGNISVADTEKTGLEADPMLRFFAWEATIVAMENPGEKQIVAEIEVGLKGGYLRELPTEDAEAIRTAGKLAKAEGRDERSLPFIRILRRPAPNPKDRESLANFRCVSYNEDADRERESRNRLVFYALNGAWSDHLTERKEGRRAFTDFLKGCQEFGDLASGKAGVGIGDISKEDPWVPKRRDPETKKLVPLTHRGTDEIVKNWGPVVAVVAERTYGQVVYFPVLNREVEIKDFPVKAYVASGMFMPIFKAGAWEEGPDGVLNPVEFRFEPNKGFAGLRPASREIWREPWQLSILKTILQKAGKLEAPSKENDREGITPKSGDGPEEPETKPAGQLKTRPRTKRGERLDGTEAGEPRARTRRRSGGSSDEEEVPDLSRVGTLAEGQQAVGEGE